MKSRNPIFLIFIIFLSIIGLSTLLFSQTKDVNNIVINDSLKTAKIIDDSLTYEADSLEYYVNDEKIRLLGQAIINYGFSKIQSDSMIIDFDKEQAFASGQIIMQDQDQILIGESVYYDINTETGFIIKGASQFDLGFYYGQNIRKIDKEVFDVDNGRFTTCDAEVPHFDIRAEEMRVYRNHMVVGRPVIFYVNEFPVMGFPFAAFSIKRGRESGILVPEPGYNPTDGKYIKNIAFYYPINDYSDITVSADFMELSGWKTELYLPYKKRYDYDGYFNVLLRKQISQYDSYSYNWSITERHHQKFYDKSDFSANLDFASSREIWNNESDVNKRLQEQITSSLSYRKPFKNSTLYLSSSYTEDLINDTRYLTLPSFSYSLPSKPVYELFPVNSDSLKQKEFWWKNFSYSWRSSGIHTGSVKEKSPSFSALFYESTKDSLGKYINEHHAGAKQSIGLSWNNSIFGWLKLNQSFNFDEVIMDRDINNKKLAHGYSYYSNSGMSFSLYGLRKFENIPLRAIRHIMTPSVNYSWSPDFSEQNADLYSFGSIGVSKSKKSSSLGMSLEQKWQIKYITPESNEEKKLNDFIVLRSNTAYNLINKDKPWSDIYHTLVLNPFSFENDIKFSTNQSFGATQDVYKFNIKSWRFNMGVSLTGDAIYQEYFPLEKNEFITRKFFENSDSLNVQDKIVESIADLEKLVKPGSWRVSFDYDYSKDKISEYVSTSLRSSLNMKLSTNWSLNYTNYINMKDHELLSQTINLVRELHCWRLTFAYTKSANFWDYRVVLFNLKLPDSLKLQTTDHN